MFTVAGESNGRTGAVVWLEPDELDGDAWAIALVLELVESGVTVWATPTGPHYIANVRDAEPALVTILSVFEQGSTHVLGQPPTIATDVPKGATP